MPLAESAQAPEISVIVPSYNSEKTIAACLQALVQQELAAPFEIILVDSSTDRTPEIVRAQFPQIRVFHLKEKTLPGVARNHGLAHARGEILALTDSDCIVEPRWLQAIQAAHATGEYHVIGGGVRNAFPWHPISIAEFFLEFREFSVYSPRREIDVLPTNNLSVRRAIFARFGTFSDLRASEDVVFIHQLRSHGVKVLFEPRIRIRHMNRRAWQPYLRNQNILGKHSALTRRLFPLPGAALAAKPWVAPLLPFIRTVRTLQFT
ncbi:glycosyltransferase family 2 protein, partial [candidate division KSB1 bacterium]|nr:glycosyltransferase family 2 protein [candidate division KSB1 bacterium]